MKDILDLKELLHKMLESAMDEVLFNALPEDISDIVQRTKELFGKRSGYEISEREAIKIYKLVKEFVELICSIGERGEKEGIRKGFKQE